MMRAKFFVADTNSLISVALIRASITALALDNIFIIGKLALSEETFLEFSEVIFRSKFDKYLSDERRINILDRVEQDGVFFSPTLEVYDCRDPKDNKFLTLALASKASCVISGDQDLLILHPYRNIPILNASDFMIRFQKDF